MKWVNWLMILIVSWSLVDLGPLGLDEDIYNARDLCTWPVHVLRHREYRLSDNYRHCAETQDHRLEGSKTASTPPYILIADQYCLQITVPISVTYYPIMSYFLYLLRVYIEALELHSQSSRSFNSSHCKAYNCYWLRFRYRHLLRRVCPDLV